MTDVYSTKGDKVGDLQLPQVFSTPFRHDLIHRIYTIQTTHSFQPKGTHPTAGMDVSADSLDPPTGHGQSRVARINAGGAGGRGGQGGEVASTRGGRQAHPPNVEKVIHKKSNKKERMVALCSAIAATASKERILHRNHFIGKFSEFPIIVQDNFEAISKTSELVALLESLGISKDADRLHRRKVRTSSRRTKRSLVFWRLQGSKLSCSSAAMRWYECKNIKPYNLKRRSNGGKRR